MCEVTAVDGGNDLLAYACDEGDNDVPVESSMSCAIAALQTTPPNTRSISNHNVAIEKEVLLWEQARRDGQELIDEVQQVVHNLPGDIDEAAVDARADEELEEIVQEARGILERAEQLIAKLSDQEINEGSLEQLIAQINLISALWHRLMKKAAKDLSTSFEKFRQEEVAETCGHLRAWHVAALQIAGGVLQLGAGFASLSPRPCVNMGRHVHRISGGRFGGDLNRFDMNNARGIRDAGKAFGGAIGGAGQATQSVGQVAQSRTSSHQTKSQHDADNAMRRNEEYRNEISREGNLVDQNQRNNSENEERLHRTKETILRS